MRSLLDIKTEIVELQEDLKGSAKKSQVNRIKKKIEFLNFVLLYLETSPAEKYIDLKIEELEEKITILSNRFNAEDYKDPKEAFKKHLSDNGVPQLRKQLKTLRYIKK